MKLHTCCRVQQTSDLNSNDDVTEDEEDVNTEDPARLLTANYQGAIEFLFEIGTWLTYADEDAQSTRNIIESVVMETILQNYDRSKAIKCLTSETVTVSF